jgi:hypothetical protein
VVVETALYIYSHESAQHEGRRRRRREVGRPRRPPARAASGRRRRREAGPQGKRGHRKWGGRGGPRAEAVRLKRSSVAGDTASPVHGSNHVRMRARGTGG